ncbi:MAG: hypothetical protein ACHREM_16440, partial [Polyangiales bacterium]
VYGQPTGLKVVGVKFVGPASVPPSEPPPESAVEPESVTVAFGAEFEQLQVATDATRDTMHTREEARRSGEVMGADGSIGVRLSQLLDALGA